MIGTSTTFGSSSDSSLWFVNLWQKKSGSYSEPLHRGNSATPYGELFRATSFTLSVLCLTIGSIPTIPDKDPSGKIQAPEKLQDPSFKISCAAIFRAFGEEQGARGVA